ncbi:MULTISPECIES: SpoIIE family protein phosphatase [unclassified Nocardioides]|uniref:SpoIIE family protein phosphatase n=1 Tax=unclassified Nocardioides TaxID=2615069 RepID=UPI0009F13265|nr:MULTISPECIES: SpoIIE family protein phosphatase [unclassified Nocardioides]GAW52167.1 Putative regulatory protein [Nocardioides sp. PD653-B2]GAW55565.1 putative regulatory protein [Nocardioides sp. PD653]
MTGGPELLDDLVVAALALDPTGRISYANASARALLAAEVGVAARDLLLEEPDRGAFDEVLARVLAGSTWAGDLRLVCADGRVHELATSWSPHRVDADVTGVVVLVEGGDTSSDAGLLGHRINRLASVSADLLASATIDEVSAVVTEQMTAAAGATVGSFSLLVDDETLALIGIHGGAEGVASRWATFPLAGNTPAADCVRARRPLLLDGRDEIRSRYPDLESAAEGERSIVCLPLVVGARDLGVVSLSFPGRRHVDTAELLFLELLAAMGAHAVDRIQAQDAAADREAKLAFLAEASVQLSGDLDYESTLTAVAEAAVPWFADWCAISLEEDGRLRNIAVAHAHPGHAYLVEELQTKYAADPDAERGTHQVLRTGVSELIPEISDEMLALTAYDDEHLRLLRALNFRSALICPLKSGDRVLGVVTWVAGEHGRRFGPADLAFGEDLARRAAVAIDNAELHSELRDVALRLQHAVLPERLPDLPDWTTAVVYRPAGRTDVGGDFYDVIDLGGGRVAMFVGDVMGRGVQAASVMAQMRSAIRTLVALDADPAAVMDSLDLVFDRLELDHLVTVAYAVTDPVAGTAQVINAGHPAPLILRHDGSLDIVANGETMLLGAGGGARDVATLPLDPGDTILLYTDGLVERRGEDLDDGMARLIDVCRNRGNERLGDFLQHMIDAVRDPTRDDDVAALAVCRR